MIREVETTLCKMYEQFQAIVTKLERAVEENRPIHQFEEELVEDRRTLGRSAVEAFVERQGETQPKARAEAKRKRAEVAERKKYLEELVPKADKTWRKVELLLETTIQRDYDEAVRWLRDLRDLAEMSLCGTETWEERVRALRRRHLAKTQPDEAI